ncbi:alpha/beta fold hydrolase [Kribbella sp. NPDC004536]|uniref:alpha/beta fold hydrolase n=1 Tax=Kribbella sp. NPDC004536 TaxID=3364106 RepID=UPI00369025D1
MTIASLRTPDARFDGLVDYPFEPHYVDIDAGGTQLRVHYLDERPDPADASGETVLLLHGEPTWSYLYRHVIPPLIAAGHRCVAPDLVGFGKSDKPTDRFDYTYQSHLDWLRQVVFDQLELSGVTMLCHDWGGLLGLRLLGEHPDRFRRVVVTSTSLPTGDREPSGPLSIWLQLSQRSNRFWPARSSTAARSRNSVPPSERRTTRRSRTSATCRAPGSSRC